MFTGKLTIAGQNGEMLDEFRNYHRDEDFRIVKQRDDLVSALRYAIMMRRHGKALSDCDGIGYGCIARVASENLGGSATFHKIAIWNQAGYRTSVLEHSNAATVFNFA